MTGLTVKYRVSFTNGTPAPKRGPTKLARRLALAHTVDRLVDAGVLRSYAEAAELLGITTASIAQVAGLVYLSPAIQEAILRGEMIVAERRLWDVARVASWTDQGRMLLSTPSPIRAGGVPAAL